MFWNTILEARIKKLENPIIGIVYLINIAWDTGEKYVTCDNFTQADVDDRYGDGIKIKYRWHKKENVIFYNDVEKKVVKIKNRIQKEIDKEYKKK